MIYQTTIVTNDDGDENEINFQDSVFREEGCEDYNDDDNCLYTLHIHLTKNIL